MSNNIVSTLVCSECGKPITGSDYKIEGDSTYCINCFQNTHVTCTICGAVIPHNNAHKDNEGMTICNNCLSGKYKVCENCGTAVPYDEIHITWDCEIICDACASSKYVRCDNCEELVRYDDAAHYGDSVFCEGCFNGLYEICPVCGEEYMEHGSDMCELCSRTHVRCAMCGNIVYYEDTIVTEQDTVYCYTCYSNRTGLHDSSYKPTPIFHGKGNLYFGLEIETDDYDDSIVKCATEIKKRYVRDEKYVYMKCDGSLNNGIEFVTHPMTYDFLVNFDWDTLFAEVAKHGGDPAAASCGFHIHVSASYFKEYKNIYRFIVIFDKLWDLLSAISGRDGNFEYCERMPKKVFIAHNNVERNISEAKETRYRCVNITNVSDSDYYGLSGTVEVRLWAGVSNKEKLLEKVELTYALVELATSNKPICVESILEIAKEKNLRRITEFLDSQIKTHVFDAKIELYFDEQEKAIKFMNNDDFEYGKRRRWGNFVDIYTKMTPHTRNLNGVISDFNYLNVSTKYRDKCTVTIDYKSNLDYYNLACLLCVVRLNNWWIEEVAGIDFDKIENGTFPEMAAHDGKRYFVDLSLLQSEGIIRFRFRMISRVNVLKAYAQLASSLISISRRKWNVDIKDFKNHCTFMNYNELLDILKNI